MPSFTSSDYDELFRLGARLYENNTDRALVRETAVQLMAMCESVRGQKAGWPLVAKRYRYLTRYPIVQPSAKILSFPK